MPKLNQPMDLHRDRYLDPYYHVHFEDEDLHYREQQARSKFWSWYYWIKEGLFYWNVIKNYSEDQLPEVSENDRAMQKMLDRLMAERALKKQLENKHLMVNSDIANWNRLNQEALEINDYLRIRAVTASAEADRVVKAMRFRDMDSFRHARMLRRERAVAARRAAQREAAAAEALSSEPESQADSQCTLPVHPDPGYGVLDLGDPFGLGESSMSSLGAGDCLNQPVEIMPTMTPTIQNFMREHNLTAAWGPKEIQIEVEPRFITRSEINAIFNFENDLKAGGRQVEPFPGIHDHQSVMAMPPQFSRDSIPVSGEHRSPQRSGTDSSPEKITHRTITDQFKKLPFPCAKGSKQAKRRSAIDVPAHERQRGFRISAMDFDDLSDDASSNEIPSAHLSHVPYSRHKPSVLPSALKTLIPGTHAPSALVNVSTLTRKFRVSDSGTAQSNQRSTTDTPTGQNNSIFPEDSEGSFHEIPSAQLSYVTLHDQIPTTSNEASNANVSSCERNPIQVPLCNGRLNNTDDSNANEVPSVGSLIVLDTRGYEILGPAREAFLQHQATTRMKMQEMVEINANLGPAQASNSSVLNNHGYNAQGIRKCIPGRAHRVDVNGMPVKTPLGSSSESSLDTFPSFPSVASFIALDEWGYEIKGAKREDYPEQAAKLKPSPAKEASVVPLRNRNGKSEEHTELSDEQSVNSDEESDYSEQEEEECKTTYLRGWIQDYGREE